MTWTVGAAPPPSPNLVLDQRIAERRERGETLVHLGFGESQLPVPDFLAERLRAGAVRNGYGQISGALDAREAAAGYFCRRGIPTDASQMVLAPGSKPLLLALTAVVTGAILLPQPCWVTYPEQARLCGRPVVAVPIPTECGGVPDPDLLVQAISRTRAAGLTPGTLVLTLPDNPTGTVAPTALVRRLCEIAENEDLLVVSDEIYRDTIHDIRASMTSPAELIPDRTVVTSGLSKSLALGGWRIGFARFPRTPAGRALRDAVVGFASEVWSTLAGPMQEVACYALSEPAPLLDYLRSSTRLHATVAAAVYDRLAALGIKCRYPTAGFYLYPDFEPLRAVLVERGIRNSAGLERALLEQCGVAVLGGHHFGDDSSALRFRAATSMLYGSDDEHRWQALGSANPLSLPEISEQLDRIDGALRALVGDTGCWHLRPAEVTSAAHDDQE